MNSNEPKPKKKRFNPRPILVAGAGLALLAMGACGGFTAGNLVAPSCPDGGAADWPNCGADAGTDAGRADGGP